MSKRSTPPRPVVSHKVRNTLALLAVLILCLLPRSPSDSWLKGRVVKLRGEHSMCSGEQIEAPSGQTYILTAAHCREQEDATGSIMVTTETGEHLLRKVIAEDPASDLLLLEGLPGVSGLKVADHQSRHVRTFTHGHNYDTYRTEGDIIQETEVKAMLGIVSIGDQPGDVKSCAQAKDKIEDVDFMGISVKVCLLDVQEMVTTAFIAPGSSGGMVVDDAGRLVGVVSAGGEGYGFLVRLSDIQAFIKGY